jgi:hypothetical protein
MCVCVCVCVRACKHLTSTVHLLQVVRRIFHPFETTSKFRVFEDRVVCVCVCVCMFIGGYIIHCDRWLSGVSFFQIFEPVFDIW